MIRSKIDENKLSLLAFSHHGANVFEFQIVNQTILKLNNKHINLTQFTDQLSINVNLFNRNYIDVQLNMASTTRLYLNMILKTNGKYELSVKNRYCFVNDVNIHLSGSTVNLNDKQFFNRTYFKYFKSFKILNRPKCHLSTKYANKTGQTNIQSPISNKQLYSCDLYSLCGLESGLTCKNNLVYNFNEYLMSYLIMYDYKCTCPNRDEDFGSFTHANIVDSENSCYYAKNLYDVDSESEICEANDGLCLNNGTCVNDRTSDMKFKCLCRENFTSKRY